MSKRRYVFHGYSFDPAARELRLDGALIALPASTFDCLAWLIEHRDRAVGRDELIAAVWGRVDVSDSQLVQLLLKARRAVGDSGDEQKIIRTIPRFGYRWIAPVDVIEPFEDDAPTPTDETGLRDAAPPPVRESWQPAGSVARTRLWLVLGLMATAFIIVMLVWHLLPRGGAYLDAQAVAPLPEQAAVTRSARGTTAVLPAMVEAPVEWEWLRLGLMELIANRLTRAGVPVIPSESVMIATRSTGQHDVQDVVQLMRTVGATRAIQPKVRVSRGKWRIQLTATGASGESRDAEAEDDDPISAAHESAIHILAALGVNVLEERSPSTQDALLRAKALMLAGDFASARTQLASVPDSVQASPEARLLLIRIAHASGHHAEARSGAQALLSDLAGSENVSMRAQAFNALGASEIMLGLPDEAEQAFSRALDAMNEVVDPALSAQAYLGRGVSHALRNSYQPAIADFGRARIELTSTGDALALARLSLNEGALQGDRGHPAQALDSFRDAARHFERLGALDQLASALANQAKAHLELMEYTHALDLEARIRDLGVDQSRPAAREIVIPTQAMVLITTGQLNQARALLGTVGAKESSRLRSLTSAMLAEVEFDAGQPGPALSHASAVFEGGADALPADIAARLWLVQVRSQLQQGDTTAASDVLGRFDHWSLHHSNRAVALRLVIAQAEVAHARGYDEEANGLYMRAMHLADTPAVPADIAEVASSWGRSLIEQGNLDQARAVVGRIARWSDMDFKSALAQVELYRALEQPEALASALAQAKALAGDRPLPEQLVH